MNTITKFYFTILLVVGIPLMLFGQTNFSTQIMVADGTGETDTITIGVNTTATYGIDASLNEYELPPVPPSGVFDARSVNIAGRPTAPPEGLGQGVLTDIRSLSSDIQTDTFKINFQPSTEGGANITLTWADDLSTLGGGNWKLLNTLSGSATIEVDMTTQTSVVVDADENPSLYVLKSDAASFRSFSLEDLALDVDLKGKRGKSYKAKSNQVEFCLYVVNTQATPADLLYMEFKTPIDSSRLTFSPFTTVQYNIKQKPNALTKLTFTGGTINPGDTVVICGYGVKDGTKAQAVGSYYWASGSTILGKKISGKLVDFTQNDVRIPMPNTVIAGEQMMLQALPLKTDYLYAGLTQAIPGVKKDTFRYVQFKKYVDVLKTLIKDYGKKGYLLADSLASCLNNFDDKKKGYRAGKTIAVKQKTLPPDKHRNRLLGEALVLKVNILFSQTQKTPAGFGSLVINDPGGQFDGKSLDSLSAQGDQYLTLCTVGKNPSTTADELADMMAQVNSAFQGDLDTLSWGGGKVYFTGAKAIGDVSFLKRVPGLGPKIIPDVVAAFDEIPKQYALEQNYPNPFNPTTTISFTLPEDGLVSVKIYNMLGQVVATLADRTEFTEGANEVSFDAQTLSSGVYFYRIDVSDAQSGAMKFQQTRKMVLLK